jgi:hypothetical protein
VEYDSTKVPYQPHATMDAAAIATATTLSCYHAISSGELYVRAQWGATGSVIIDILGKTAAEETKTFSALSTHDFTSAALTTGRPAGTILKLSDANDYVDTAWKEMGHREETTIIDSTPSSDVFDEEGDLVNSFSGVNETAVETVWMQCSKAERDFLAFEAPSKFFALKIIAPAPGVGNEFTIIKKAKIVRDMRQKYANGQNRNIGVRFAILKDGTAEKYEVWEG